VSHLVIAEVSQFLRHVLWLGLQDAEDTRQLITGETDIVLSNPAEPVTGAKRLLSLWLYQILPNEHLRNPDMVRRRDQKDDAAQFYPPLVVNLLYLLTPSTADDLGDQKVLGRALQIFHDQSVLRMETVANPGRAEELHVSLAPRTIEELAEVWEAMQKPYRLSVCYEVRAVRIDSTRRLAAGRIADRQSELAEA